MFLMASAVRITILLLSLFEFICHEGEAEENMGKSSLKSECLLKRTKLQTYCEEFPGSRVFALYVKIKRENTWGDGWEMEQRILLIRALLCSISNSDN